MNRANFLKGILGLRRNATMIYHKYLTTPREYYPGEKLLMREAHIIKDIGLQGLDNVSALVDKLEITNGAVSQFLSKLEKRGFILRTQDENDKRQYSVSLTEKGKELYCLHTEYDDINYAEAAKVLLDSSQLNISNQKEGVCMIYSIYFSPTGGTKKVADILTGVWPQSEAIDLCMKEDYSKYRFTGEDTAIVSVPSYGGRVPDIVAKRLKEMAGNGAKAVLNVVYGNRDYDDTLLELKDVLSQQGFIPMAAVTAIAEHSIIREIAANRPDSEDQEELLSFAQSIKEFLLSENGSNNRELHVSGNHPYKEYNGVPLKPKAGKHCSQCGICAEHCPVEAIPKEDPKSTDTQRCISCMGCIAVCPQHARKVSSLLLKGAGVSLKQKCSEHRGNTCTLAALS